MKSLRKELRIGMEEDFKIKFYYYKSFDRKQWDIVYNFVSSYLLNCPCIIFEEVGITDFYFLADLSDYFSKQRLISNFIYRSSDFRPTFLPKFDYSFEMTFQRGTKISKKCIKSNYISDNYSNYKSDFFIFNEKEKRELSKLMGMISQRKNEFLIGTSKWTGRRQINSL